MNLTSAWPALASGEPLPPAAEYERGVWGKVHGAPTDFRWIARSPGFGRDRADLSLQLNLGGEDAPATFSAWRSLADRCYAVSGYPSRAMDAAGRRGFLEKQVLEWQRPPDMPAALAALLLLPRAATLTDEIWWDRCAGDMLTETAFFLPIAQADQESLPFEEDDLGVTIERGRQQLREAVSPDALARMYGQLLAGSRPALLGGIRQPLGAEALAALLLPLPREIADRLSLAGWLPTQRPSWPDLGTRWDVIATPAESAAVLPPSSLEQARGMADALLATAPAPPQKAEPPRPVKPPAIVPSTPRLAAPLRPGHRLKLPAPDAGAPPVLARLHAFADAVDRRWLAPDPARQTRTLESSAASLIGSWILELLAQRPPYAHAEQWSIKVDLLRSAALVLCPDPSTLQIVGIPTRASRVPALFFGPMLERPDALANLGERALRQLLEQSTGCSAPKSVAQPLRDWLQRWREDTRRRDVNLPALIGYALAMPAGQFSHPSG